MSGLRNVLNKAFHETFHHHTEIFNFSFTEVGRVINSVDNKNYSYSKKLD